MKDRLKTLRMSKFNGEQKIERGGRKAFFRRVWERLHGTSTGTTKDSNGSDTATTTARATAIKYENNELDIPSLLTSRSISSTFGEEDTAVNEEEFNQPKRMAQL